MSWFTVNEAYILSAMPSEIEGKYTTWLAENPDKAGRLGEIAGSVVADFRAGLSANPAVEMDSGEETLPERCLQHAVTVIVYHLSLEIGVSINMSAQTAFINAQTYMRNLYTSDAVVDRDAVGDTPTYNADVERAARTLALV
jgi:hypothetical protein